MAKPIEKQRLKIFNLVAKHLWISPKNRRLTTGLSILIAGVVVLAIVYSFFPM